MANPSRGTRGMAVAPHSLASQSALAVLREGGNAVEAMIAATATIAVVYPHMNGIGGDSFWLVRTPADGVVGIDACGASAAGVSRADYAGKTAIPFRGGSAAITVAATMSGWNAAYRHSVQKLGGKLPLSRLLEDAIHYANSGIAVTYSQHMNTTKKLPELKDIHGFAGAFLIDGKPPATGDVFLQPRMGATLEQLARAGLDDYYRGDLARAIAKDLAAAQSPVTLADLEAHQALIRTPLELAHSLGRVYNMPPPTQGLVSLLILGQMDRLGIERFDHLSADYVHAAVEATKRAFLVRDKYITDPDVMKKNGAPDPQSLLAATNLAAEAAKTKGEPMPEAAVRAWFERLFKGSYVPHVIEPSAGLDRMALAVIAKAFSETEKVDEKGKKEVITVLRLHPRVAPIKVGVFPLLKNKPELVAKAREVYALLKKHMNCFYDETASIGRRYARQDEVGTPFGVTIDFDSLGEKGPELLDTVTLRHRDSGEQERVKISDLLGKLLPLVS